MTDEQLSALRQRLSLLRDDLIARLSKEFGASEISLIGGVMAAIRAVDQRLDEIRSAPHAFGDAGRQ